MNKKEVLDIARRIFAQCKIIRKERLDLPMIHPRFVIGEAVDNIGMCISELEDLCGKPTAKETEKTDEPKPTNPTDHSFWDGMKLREDNDLLRQANIRLTTERDLYDRLYHELLGRCSTEAPNAQQIQKRRYACLDAKCKDCGTVYRAFFNPSDDRVEAYIVAQYKNRKCGCGGAFEISPSYIVDERGNAI